jgi:uncharacterized membrane protein
MYIRMGMAVVSLLAIIDATYLWLYKLGYIGQLTCSVGSCETVNTSPWAIFIGAPVAAWGVAFYVTVFVLVLLSLQPRFADDRRLPRVILALTAWGVLFSAWLTYLELFVIHAICMWCVVSAILVSILFVLSLWEQRRLRGAAPASEM